MEDELVEDELVSMAKVRAINWKWLTSMRDIDAKDWGKEPINWKKWATIIGVVATLLAIIVSGFTIWDRINEKNQGILLEQKIDPNVLKGFHEKGLEVHIEKGITIRPTNPDDEPILGGETDEHGCQITAGYSWNEDQQKCIKEFESNVENQHSTE